MSLFTNSKEEEPESSPKRKRRTRRGRFLSITVLLAAVAGGGAYLLHRQGVDLGQTLRTARVSSEDAATTAAVKTALALSSKVSAFGVDVDTTRGVVRLEGVVPSESIRDLTVAIAADTSGVEAVEDRLRIEPAIRPSPEIERLKKRIADLEIRADLDGKLLRSPELEGRDIRVTVSDRNVTLEGSVESAEMKYRAERIAQSVANVREVVNELQAPDQEEPARPTEDARTALMKQIHFELFATGAFNLEQMEVRNLDGVVTLRGEVRSQAEKLLAERIVRDIEGVERVVNELDVLAAPFRASVTAPSTRRVWPVVAQSGGLW